MHPLLRRGRKTSNKNTAIIQLATDICSYDTLECCHSVDYTDEKMSLGRSTAVGYKCCCRINADVYFEPGSIDPVTMPYYSCCIAARAWCGFNHLANGCGCRMDALPCIPACILMSLGSWQGRCTVELQPQSRFSDAQKPRLAEIKQITRYFLPPFRKHQLWETKQLF